MKVQDVVAQSTAINPCRHRPQPPLAEVQVAEEEGLLLCTCRELGPLWPKFLVRSSMTDLSIVQRVRTLTPCGSSDQTFDDGLRGQLSPDVPEHHNQAERS